MVGWIVGLLIVFVMFVLMRVGLSLIWTYITTDPRTGENDWEEIKRAWREAARARRRRGS